MPSERCSIEEQSIEYCAWRVVSSDLLRSAHHITRHNTPNHNILSAVSQLSISQNTLETHPEDGNVMPKHAEATIQN